MSLLIPHLIRCGAVLLCAAFVAGPAQGVIWINSYMVAPAGLTATSLGSNTSTVSNATVSMTTTAAVSSGESIVAIVGVGNNAGIDAYTDESSNTYTETRESANNSGHVGIAFSSSVTALPSGSTMTGSLSLSNNAKAIAAVKLNAAISAVASAANSATGTSTTPSVTTGASVPSDAVVIGAVSVNGSVTITLPAGWTALFNSNIGAAKTYAFAYKITDTAASVTFDPTLSVSADWSTAIVAYND